MWESSNRHYYRIPRRCPIRLIRSVLTRRKYLYCYARFNATDKNSRTPAMTRPLSMVHSPRIILLFTLSHVYTRCKFSHVWVRRPISSPWLLLNSEHNGLLLRELKKKRNPRQRQDGWHFYHESIPKIESSAKANLQYSKRADCAAQLTILHRKIQSFASDVEKVERLSRCSSINRTKHVKHFVRRSCRKKTFFFFMQLNSANRCRRDLRLQFQFYSDL